MHSIQKTSNRPHRHLTTAQAPLLPEADEKSHPFDAIGLVLLDGPWGSCFVRAWTYAP